MKTENKGQVQFIRKNGKVIPIRAQGRGRASQTPKKPQSKQGDASVAASVAVGAAAFALSRKFRVLSSIPALANLQKAVAKSRSPIKYTTVGKRQLGKSPQTMFKTGFEFVLGFPLDRKINKGDVVLHRFVKPATYKEASHVINPYRVSKKWAAKDQFAKRFKGDRADAIPKTYRLDQAMDLAGNQKGKLKDLFGSKKFLIKESGGALGNVDDFVNERTVGKTRLTRKQDYVIQERLNLKDEYRAHFLNGKVFGITHRRIPNESARNRWNKITKRLGFGEGGGAFIPVMNPAKRRQIAKFLEQNVDTSDLRKNESLFAAFDVGEIKGGKLKLIEANTAPGTMLNPAVNRQLRRLAEGRISYSASAFVGAKSGVGAHIFQQERGKNGSKKRKR